MHPIPYPILNTCLEVGLVLQYLVSSLPGADEAPVRAIEAAVSATTPNTQYPTTNTQNPTPNTQYPNTRYPVLGTQYPRNPIFNEYPLPTTYLEVGMVLQYRVPSPPDADEASIRVIEATVLQAQHLFRSRPHQEKQHIAGWRGWRVGGGVL